MKKKLIATLLVVTLTMTTALTGCGGSDDKETAGNDVSNGVESNDNTALESNDNTDVQGESTTNELGTLVLDVAGTEIVITKDLDVESFVEILGNHDENNDEDDFYYNTNACRISIKDDFMGKDALGGLAVHVRQWDGYTTETSDVTFAGFKLGDSIEQVKEKFGEPSVDKFNKLSYSMIPISDDMDFTTFIVEYDENGIITDMSATISFGEEN